MTLAETRPSSQTVPESASLKRWTVDEYHRISSLGILSSNERTELLAGHITLMAAKGTPHVTALHLFANTLRDRLGRSALVRTQDPIQLDHFSEPGPDIAVVEGDILDYADHHPLPQNVLLMVEVADSTLRHDCDIKDKLYAQAGIADYWVVDVRNRQLHIFREPTDTGYASHLILKDPHQVSPLSCPELVLELTAILPPAS